MPSLYNYTLTGGKQSNEEQQTEARPLPHVAQELTQQLLVLLLHEAPLDTQARVGKVLAHVVVDLLGPHAALALLEEALDAFSSGFGRVAADVLALGRG